MIHLPIVDKYKAPVLFFAERDIILLSTFLSRYNGNIGVVDNLGSYILGIIRKIILQFYSYKQVVESVNDYNSAMALVRFMADSICSFVLVYDHKNEDEQKIRHCLYVLDGVKKSLEELSYPIEKTDYISDEDYAVLKSQHDNAIKNREKIRDYMIRELNKFSLIKQNPTSQTIIANADWKYKNITVKSTPKNRYSWNEMYSFLSLNEEGQSFISFLSQNVHGLSISNLFVDGCQEDFEPLNSLVYHIIHYSLLRTCINIFGEDTFKRAVLDDNPQLVHLLTDEELKEIRSKQMV
ncbi:MAG: hypothetical protein JFT11_10570 [Muribaculaceae bacterium]|nr:hypothetical protein [Muribaculaceae bacterium]